MVSPKYRSCFATLDCFCLDIGFVYSVAGKEGNTAILVLGYEYGSVEDIVIR